MAILYADKITGSMDRAISETNRRRRKQIGYNRKHKITPRTIQKSVQDIMENARSMRGKNAKSLDEEDISYPQITPDKLAQEIDKLEKRMYRHARDLEFEEAAKVRDEIARVRRVVLALPDALPN